MLVQADICAEASVAAMTTQTMIQRSTGIPLDLDQACRSGCEAATAAVRAMFMSGLAVLGRLGAYCTRAPRHPLEPARRKRRSARLYIAFGDIA